MLESVHNTRKYHSRIPKKDVTEPVTRFYYVLVNEMKIKFKTKIELYDFLNVHKEVKDVYVESIERLIL